MGEGKHERDRERQVGRGYQGSWKKGCRRELERSKMRPRKEDHGTREVKERDRGK